MLYKDHFSEAAETYARSRPLYPEELYSFLYRHCSQYGHAWDCGTGNGQVAQALSTRFEKVYASDISRQQLEQAKPNGNIQYVCEASEECTAADGLFDLIVVAQAIHWFKFDAFYKQVFRTMKPDGLFATWTYENIQINAEVDDLVRHFYTNIIGPYWDPERVIIEQRLQSIPFPFDEIPCPEFQIRDHWSGARMLGYLNSWSACRHYYAAKGTQAVDLIRKQLFEIWPEGDMKEIRFPVYMRMGRKMQD